MERGAIRKILDATTEVSLEEGLYYYRKGSISPSFEGQYLNVRKKEGRIYPDEVARELPDVYDGHPLEKEWAFRKKSVNHLIAYLAKLNSPSKKILEVGCGNGWLSNRLSRMSQFEICGVDVNEFELKQACRLSNSDRLSYVAGNIMESIFPPETFDVIILASSIQYFPDLKILIARLQQLLTSTGEIHILDSPIYDSVSDAEKGRRNSYQYFSSIGFPEMTTHYFHHTFNDLGEFRFTHMHNPRSWGVVLKRQLGISQVPFPWIRIMKS